MTFPSGRKSAALPTAPEASIARIGFIYSYNLPRDPRVSGAGHGPDLVSGPPASFGGSQPTPDSTPVGWAGSGRRPRTVPAVPDLRARSPGPDIVPNARLFSRYSCAGKLARAGLSGRDVGRLYNGKLHRGGLRARGDDSSASEPRSGVRSARTHGSPDVAAR
jgi:hypothetical protein